jgi:hypothetical protein
MVASLVAEGDRHLFADEAWRRELAAWMRPRRRGEGLPFPAPIVPVARFIVSHVDLGPQAGRQNASLVSDAPAVGVIGTAEDHQLDWLRAGQALAAALLTAARVGVQAGFANQPCQVPALRQRLSALVEEPGHPQLVLRLGRPTSSLAAVPRRPVSAVFS